MVYRQSADELARRSAEVAQGPLLRLDAPGRPGAAGRDGADGADGYAAGQDGQRGGDAGPAEPGGRGGTIHVAIASDTREGIAIVRGQTTRGPVDTEIEYLRPGEIELLARGGRGGDGGRGGRGGDGARGRDGRDASRFSSGEDGGRGGDGGDGGIGSDGARGGPGGEIVVRVHERDAHLLMLVAYDVRGGDGGRHGENGDGGDGGRGGRGGSDYSWSETESYTDSDGRSQTRTTWHRNSGGRDGPPGRDGSTPSVRLHDGPSGEPGTFAIEVVDDSGSVVRRAGARYDVRVVSFAHRNANEDGIYEPEEKVFVSRIVVENCGGMPLPAYQDVVVGIVVDGWIAPNETQRLVLPRALPPGASHVFETELELTLRVFHPQKPGGPLSAPETIRMFAEVPSVRRRFATFFREENEPMGRIQVRFPIELSPVEGLYSLAPGQAARVRWHVTNVSEKAFGTQSMVGRAVGVRLFLDGGELGDAHVLFVDDQNRRWSLASGYEIPIPRLEAKEKRTFEGTIAIAPDAPPYTCVRLVASAELGHVAKPGLTRSIQLQDLTVRIGMPSDGRDADLLLVTNNRTTREELDAWRKLATSLGLTTSIWDASLEGGMSVLSEVVAGKKKHRLVVMLNNVMDTAAGERRPSVLVDKATILSLANAGTHVLYVGRAPDAETLAIPTGPALEEAREDHVDLELVTEGGAIGDVVARFHVFRTYLWPWATPSEKHLVAHAKKIADALHRASPERRYVVVHSFAPEHPSRGLKKHLGTIEIRRTLDASRGAIGEITANAERIHDPSFPASVTPAVLNALPFTKKRELLENGSLPFGAPGYFEDPIVAAVMLDLAREQRAAMAHAWLGGRKLLSRALPMLGELVRDAFVDPIDLGSLRGQRFVELVAWLDFAARSLTRWFEWIPPLVWLRRGPRLRRFVLRAVRALLDRAGPEAKAAVRARRKVLEREPFSLDRVTLTEGNVASDADRVPSKQVIAADELAKLAAKEASRAARGRAVLERAAHARGALLLEEDFAAIAARASAGVETQVEQQETEILATAADLAALRERP